MSKMSAIRNIVLNTLADGRIHTVAEIRAIVNQHSITLPPKSSAIRTCIYDEQKRNPNLICVSRGTYQLKTAQLSSTDKTSPIGAALQLLHDELEHLTHFNWATCTEEELHLAREYVQELKAFNKSLSASLNSL